MCYLDDGGHCCPDMSRHRVSPLQTLKWQLHLLRRWQLVGVGGIRPGELDHVAEEARPRCLPWSGLCPGGPAYLVIARLYAVAVPGACSNTAECIIPVVVSAAAAATKLLAGHSMIDVDALHALTTVTRRGWDAGVGACGSQAKLTTAKKSASDRRR